MYHTIIHLSDIHIRIGDTERSRYHEYSSVFNYLIKSISSHPSIHEQTAVIVVTGDIFHHKNKLEPCGLELALQLLIDLASLAPVFMIRGNHDYRQDLPKEPDMVSALMKYQLPNVHYFDSTGIHTFHNIHFGVTAIQDTLLYGSTSGISSNLPTFPIPPPKSENTYNVALFHGSITSSTLQNGMIITPTLHGYPIEWFGTTYDAILLGDIHLQQVKRAEIIESKQPDLPFTAHCHSYSYKGDIPPWGYPGSLIQQDFGESLYGHGYIVWDLKEKEIHTFHVTNPYGFIKLRLNETTDAIDILYREISNMSPTYVSLSQLIDKLWFPSNLHISYTGKVFNPTVSQQITDYFHAYNKNVLRINPISDFEEKRSNLMIEPSNDDSQQTLHRINSLDILIEYIQTTLSKSNKTLPDIWKSWVKHPERLAISTESLPDIVTKKISERSDKLLKFSSRYLEDFGRSSSTAIRNGSLHLHTMEWNWVLNYKDENLFDFDKNTSQLSILNAKNGHGKSNFLEVICISIFGEGIPSRFNKNYTSTIICDKKPAGIMANTSIVFTLNSKKYILKRVLKNNSDKRSIAFHEVSISELNPLNNSQNLIHQGQNAVSQWVDINIGSIHAYLMTSMLSQNADSDFFSLEKLRQRSLLDQVMSLEHINSLQVLLKESIKYYKHVTDVIESYSGGVSKKRVDSVPDRSAELEGMTVAYATSTKKSAILYPKWNRISEARLLSVKDIHQMNTDHQRLITSIHSLPDKDLADILDQLSDVQEEIATHNRYLSELQSYAKLETIPLPDDLTINLVDMVSQNSDDELITKLLPLKADLYSQVCSHPYYQTNGTREIYSHIGDILKYRNDYKQSVRTDSEADIHLLIKRTKEFEIWSSMKESEFLNERSYLESQSRITKLEEDISSAKKIVLRYPSVIEKGEHTVTQLRKKSCQAKNRIDEHQDVRPNKPSISPTRLKEFESIVGQLSVDNVTAMLERVSHSIRTIPSLCSHLVVCDTKIQHICDYIKEHENMPFNYRCKACKQQPWRTKYDTLKIQLPDLEKEKKTLTDSLSELLCDEIDVILSPTNYSSYVERLRAFEASLRRQLVDIRLYHTESALHNAHQKWVTEYDKMKREYESVERDYTQHATELQQNRNILQSTKLSLQELSSTYERISSKKREYDEYRREYDTRKSLYDKDMNTARFSWYDLLLTYRCVIIVLYAEIEAFRDGLQEVEVDMRSTANNIKKRNELTHQASSLKELIDVYPIWTEWKREKDTERRLLLTIHEIQAHILHMNSLKEPGSEEERLQLILEQSNQYLKIVTSLADIFDGYREWLYKTHIGPLIQERVNYVLRMICDDRVISLDSEWLPAIDTLSWFILDGTSRVIIEKASGFQRFIVGIAIRVAFHQIGVCRIRFDQHFIDEGFTACDSDNIERVPAFLNALLGFYQGIYLVTHLEVLKACSPNHIYIQRDSQGLSQIRHGTMDIVSSIPQDGPAKKRGRPPKAKVVVTKV